MKVIKSETVADNCVAGIYATHFSVNDDELREFKEALDVISKYKDAGMKALNRSEKHADFTSYKYLYNNRDKTVTVTVEQGMIG